MPNATVAISRMMTGKRYTRNCLGRCRLASRQRKRTDTCREDVNNSGLVVRSWMLSMGWEKEESRFDARKKGVGGDAAPYFPRH